jgi:ferredoxin, 2Fe-2S
MTEQDNSRRPRLRAGLRRLAQRLLRPEEGGGGSDASTSRPAQVTFSGRPPVEAPPGITLLHLARANSIDLSHYCGGMASCGTCRVEILRGAENLSPIDGRERMVLGYESATAGHRLACQARVQGPVEVKVPRWF